MKKILVIAVCVLVLSVFYAAMAMADETTVSKSGAKAGVSTGDINSPMVTTGPMNSPIMEFKSEGSKQAIPAPDINIPSPMHLFVYAEDYRNIMTIFRFVHEHPTPKRWQLERWAKGASSEITISTISDYLASKDRNDQILFTFDVDLVKFTWSKPDPSDPSNSVKKIISEAKHKGTGTGNTTSTKVISIQNLCKFALIAMDRGHNILEIKAQVIASKVEGDTKGIAIGANITNVNNGGTAIAFPVVLGWAKGTAGKVGLEGIQAELYYKSVVSFEEDGIKTREYIEEVVWGKKKPQPQSKAETPASPPPPKAVAPTPPPAPAPNCDKCEAEKENLEGELDACKDMLKEANDKLAKAEKEKIFIPPTFTGNVEFTFDSWIIRADQRKNLDNMANYIARYIADVTKLGGYFATIGFGDKWVAKSLDRPNLDYINPLRGLQRARMVNVELRRLLLEKGVTEEQIRAIRPLSGGKDTLNFPDAKTITASAGDRRVYLAIIIPGVRGTNTK